MQSRWAFWNICILAKLEAFILMLLSWVKTWLKEVLNSDETWFIAELVGDPQEIAAANIWS